MYVLLYTWYNQGNWINKAYKMGMVYTKTRRASGKKRENEKESYAFRVF